MRSNSLEVRNPLMQLPSAQRLKDLPAEARQALDALLKDMRVDAAARAQKAWKQNKGPMAAYWKAVSVYAYHTRRALRAAA